MNKRQTGTLKEEIATNYLKKIGYHILEQNFRSRQAEIDIIARDKKTIVFIEVKYRNSSKYGTPLEAVNIQKQKRISYGALYYLTTKGIPLDYTPIRFDVIGILKEEIMHVTNAFEYRG